MKIRKKSMIEGWFNQFVPSGTDGISRAQATAAPGNAVMCLLITFAAVLWLVIYMTFFKQVAIVKSQHENLTFEIQYKYKSCVKDENITVIVRYRGLWCLRCLFRKIRMNILQIDIYLQQ